MFKVTKRQLKNDYYEVLKVSKSLISKLSFVVPEVTVLSTTGECILYWLGEVCASVSWTELVVAGTAGNVTCWNACVICILTLKHECIGNAVSYTHLDVYKRQFIDCVKLLIS